MKTVNLKPRHSPIICLPDETVYSIFARWVHRNGYKTMQSLSRLARRSRVRIHPYLPCYLQDVARLKLGEFDHLAFNHSLFTLFAACAAKKRSEKLWRAMMGRDPLNVAHIALLSSAQLRFPYVNKYCPICLCADIESYGISFWHTRHQTPGIEACAFHGVKLVAAPLRQCGWDELSLVPTPGAEPEVASEGIQKFARFAAEFLKLALEYKGNFDLLSAYQSALKERGYVTANGCLRREIAALDYCRFLQQVWGELVPQQVPSAAKVPVLLNNQSCLRQHPFTHLVFCYWLFDDLRRLVQTSCVSKPIGPETLKKQRGNNINPLQLLKSGMSLAACSRASGKSRTYLKRVAALNNVLLGDQNRSLPKNIKNLVIVSASEGQPIATIAKAQGLPEHSVCNIISLTPGLVQKRKKHRMLRARTEHRKALKDFLVQKRGCKRKDVASQLQKTFYWLYRNDKNWLYRNLPTKMVPQPNKRVDWRERDKRMATKIRQVRKSELHFHNWTEADRCFGGHGWLPRYRDRLPVTDRLLSSLIN